MIIKIATADLKLGMFVSELDRPWTDTPFPLQGFVIRSPRALEALQDYCQYVYTDTFRSAAGVFSEAQQRRRPVTSATRPSLASAASRGDILDLTRGASSADKLSDTTRFMRMAAATSPKTSGSTEPDSTSRIGRFLRKMFGSRRDAQLLPAPPHYDFIPADIELVAHPETHSLEEELPYATDYFASAKYAMNRLVADVLADKELVIHNLWTSITDFVDSMTRNGDALMWCAMTTRQDATMFGHSVRTAVHMLALAKHLGLPRVQLQQAGMVGALLDIGKTRLPMKILTKPNRLTDDQFVQMKKHVKYGLDLLVKSTPFHDNILRGIAEHHEREDGTGYPMRLKGDEIGLFGRMAAIIDTFIAITHQRSFAETLSPYVALRKLTEWSSSLFYAPLVELYIQAVGVFPVGSLVELSSGEIGVVTRRSIEQRLNPQVLVVAGPDKNLLSRPRRVDLAKQVLTRNGIAPLTITTGLAAGSHGLDLHELRLL